MTTTSLESLTLDALPGLSARATEETVAALATNAASIDAKLRQTEPDIAGLQFLRTRPAIELEDLAVVARYLGLTEAESCASDARRVRITSGAPAVSPAWFQNPTYAPPPALAIPERSGPDPQVFAEVLLAELSPEDVDGAVGTLARGWMQVLALHGPDNTSDEAQRAQRVLCQDRGCTDGHGRSGYPCHVVEALAAVLPE